MIFFSGIASTGKPSKKGLYCLKRHIIVERISYLHVLFPSQFSTLKLNPDPYS